jgi:DNA-binding transcriptional LysR family regulator
MNEDAPDFRLLKCFEALLAERSVSAAAARLELSQPTMSRALARLRRLFDDPLLLKGHGGMTPTGRALELEPGVRALIANAASIMSRPSSFDPGTARKRFVVMAAENLECLIAPYLMGSIRRAAPGIELAFRSADRDRALGWLESGEIDFRIGQWQRPAQSLRSKPLFRDHLVCIARRDHPEIRGRIAVEQFLATPHVRIDTPRVGVSMHSIDEAVAALRRTLRIALRVHSACTMCDVVGSTDLIACVTERVARKLANDYPLQILPVPLSVPRRQISLYWHERTQKQPEHRWFRQLLTDGAKEIWGA